MSEPERHGILTALAILAGKENPGKRVLARGARVRYVASSATTPALAQARGTVTHCAVLCDTVLVAVSWDGCPKGVPGLVNITHLEDE